jgi:hypothetical protein
VRNYAIWAGRDNVTRPGEIKRADFGECAGDGRTEVAEIAMF